MQSEPECQGKDAITTVADQWTWKRFLIAIGFGLVVPVLIYLFLVPRSSRTSPAIGQTVKSEPESRASMQEYARVEEDILMMKQKEEIKRIEEARKHYIPSVTNRDGVLVGTPIPTRTPDPMSGLLAMATVGFGLWAFRNRRVHSGWGVTAVAGILGGAFLGWQAMESGSFLGFTSFLSLRPAELSNLPVGLLALILFSFVTVVLGVRQIPELVHACICLVREIGLVIKQMLISIGRGIGLAFKGYGNACWWLAGKAVATR